MSPGPIVVKAESLPPVRALLAAGIELMAAVEQSDVSIPEDVADAAATLRALVDEWVVLS